LLNSTTVINFDHFSRSGTRRTMCVLGWFGGAGRRTRHGIQAARGVSLRPGPLMTPSHLRWGQQPSALGMNCMEFPPFARIKAKIWRLCPTLDDHAFDVDFTVGLYSMSRPPFASSGMQNTNAKGPQRSLCCIGRDLAPEQSRRRPTGWSRSKPLSRAP